VENEPFDCLHARYDAWFARHRNAYLSELLAIRAFLPCRGLGMEIGIGTGRFAAPLGIKVGVDPSGAMLAYAMARGIAGIQGKAENLPFRDGIFDSVLVVTTLCFVDNVKNMLLEAHRVLKPRASLVIGFVDKDSALGWEYQRHKEESVFYRKATFYSASDVKGLLHDTGFETRAWGQTLFQPLDQTQEIASLQDGHGSGGFVVVTATPL
jgi:SAM-dependent methyltransferase